jgi:hypothetical protein
LSTEAESAAQNTLGIAEWRDSTLMPRLCRDLLEKASGISVPSSQFVLKVILAYLLAVVPLNWLVCKFLLKRREWAWVVVPLLALGFAVGVERVAAYDMGYDSACDEIDLLEMYGGYPRAHLSRFSSLYTTGRAKYTITYPNEPTALALPLDNGRSIGGEDVSTAVWQSYPIPALEGFSVQPRSLALYRGEQMMNLPGSIDLETSSNRRRLINRSELELHDAVLLDFSGSGEPSELTVGHLAPGEEVEWQEMRRRDDSAQGSATIDDYEGPDPKPILAELRKSWGKRPENQGEIRLTAWIPRPVSGQQFDPALDRHRGLTAVLVHLRYGPPPSPEAPRFNLLASEADLPAAPPPQLQETVERLIPAQFIRRLRPRQLRGARGPVQQPVSPSE